ncbi:MAG TPA: hypothetical protein VLJ17_21900 [Xanthobacteraceae bacterium]|nr:hypothetical protein [Xanthobacteraceae bacterium]
MATAAGQRPVPLPYRHRANVPTPQHRNLLAPAPERLHEEITAGYNDMIYGRANARHQAHRSAN